MTEKDILKFQNALLSWFIPSHRKLPWRETNDPYAIWVSEVMLQQTQVIKVIDYYQKFLAHFPNAESLANADLNDVLKIWEGLGYYSRARHLHEAAKMVMSEFNGVVPKDYSSFRRLPGVGDYIAAAVMSQAYDLPYPVVDGNVKRVLARLYLIESPINKSTTQKTLNERIHELLDQQQSGMFNQAMMELGALICRPQNPLCHECPVAKLCLAKKYNREHEFPITEKPKERPEYHIVVGIIYENDKFLIVQRPAKGLLGGLWEFPGGKLQQGETREQACIRAVFDKTNLNIEIENHFSRVKHTYSHFKITMDVFRCRLLAGELSLRVHQTQRWITAKELNNYPFHKAIHKFLPLLKDEYLL